MSFPAVIFKHNNTEVRENLHSLVEQKLSSLDRYIGEETDVKCEVEFEKLTGHNSGEIYRVEVNLWLAGELYRAVSTKETFEAAIDLVRDDLDRELNKNHDRRQTLIRKGGREIKEAMRNGE